MIATLLFVGLEIIAGLRSHSLALLSDAGHNATDALALLLAWFGVWFQNKPADEVKTFGYQRAGVLAAFVNALTLVAVSIWIFWEGYLRFRNPEPVSDFVMIGVAAVGILLNGGVMLGLSAARTQDINIRSAFVHMLGDLLGAVAIVIGGVVIHFTGLLQVDTVLSLLIAVLIIWTAWDIIKESLNILLEGLPRGMSLKSISETMREVEGVLDVHDLHVWCLSSNLNAMSCHVRIDDIPLSRSRGMLDEINHLLSDRFQIFHTTVQFEHGECSDVEAGCGMALRQSQYQAHAHHHHH